MVDKIFILCGGFGTRLRSVIDNVPKPMAPILDKPFLYYQINEIRRSFPDTMIYLLTYYLSEVIEEYFENDSSICIIKEEQPLGTGGSVKYAIDFLNISYNNSVLVFNGDTYIKPNLKDMIKHSEREITILGSFQKNCSRYGTLKIDDDLIIDFNEKNENSKNSYINGGCYLFRNLNFFNSVDKIFSIEDEFKKKIDNNQKIYIYKYDDVFIDIGIPEDYNKMKKYVGDNR